MEKTAIDLKALLRGAGCKVTSGRLTLLELLQSESKPLTVLEIQKKLRGAADTVTLYRALEAFTLKSLVRRVDLGHSHAHYEFAAGSHHHHLVCTNCARVEDVAVCLGPSVEKKVLAQSAHFKNINQHALEFFGLCRACA